MQLKRSGVLKVLEDVFVSPCSLESFMVKDRAIGHALGCCVVLAVDDKALQALGDTLKLSLENEVLALILMIT